MIYLCFIIYLFFFYVLTTCNSVWNSVRNSGNRNNHLMHNVCANGLRAHLSNFDGHKNYSARAMASASPVCRDQIFQMYFSNHNLWDYIQYFECFQWQKIEFNVKCQNENLQLLNSIFGEFDRAYGVRSFLYSSRLLCFALNFERNEIYIFDDSIGGVVDKNKIY